MPSPSLLTLTYSLPMRCHSRQAALRTLPSLLLFAFAPSGPGMTPRPHPPRKPLFEFLSLLKLHPKRPSSTNLPGSPQPLVALLPLKLLIVSCVFTYWPNRAFTINSFSSSPSVHGEAIGLLSGVGVLCVNWEEWYLLSAQDSFEEWVISVQAQQCWLIHSVHEVKDSEKDKSSPGCCQLGARPAFYDWT